MPLQETSGTASYDAFGGGVAAVPTYIEDVFSTWLYTGTGAALTITNGIDLSTKGGLVWQKARSGGPFSGVGDHVLTDTARGNTKTIYSNTTGAQNTVTDNITAFNTTGFSLGTGASLSTNDSGTNYASWTFRKQPKFFDVVTYTGTGSNTTISHNLGSVPGCIIVKRTDTTSNWMVYHNGLTSAAYTVQLNSTGAQTSNPTVWNSTAPTSSVFSLGTSTTVNGSTGTYVAYLFAHNAGGFGASGTDNVISCGGFTVSGGATTTVNLGYEPQWVLIKRVDTTGNWELFDSMRGFSVDFNNSAKLFPNLSDAESAPGGSARVAVTSTGFRYNPAATADQMIYIAIRRGPMKTPTSGTSVFAPALASSSGTYTATSNFPVDWAIEGERAGSTKFYAGTRLTGDNTLQPNTTGPENAQSWGFDNMTGYTLPGVVGNYSGFINWMMRRAPGFFDVVCLNSGLGYGSAQPHNLGVAPELVISKYRGTSYDWWAWHTSFTGQDKTLVLNTTAAAASGLSGYGSPPTSTNIYVGNCGVLGGGATQVVYLFASVAGVSKVGSYTGNGSTQTINCGFTGGARFVLIKRTDSTGDWYVYDTARGMTTLTDPYLLLNSTAAESATLGSVTTVTTGFAVNASILAAINTNAASYIFLAIA